MWFAMINGNASRLKEGQWTVFKELYSYDAVVIDNQGRAWLGDDKNGVIVFDTDGKQVMTLTKEDGLPTSDVRSLFSFGDTIWIGTTEGLAKYENEKVSVVFGKGDPNLPSSNISAMIQMKNGEYLIGATAGIVRYDGSKSEILINFFQQNPSATLMQLSQEKSGRVWAGTSNGLFYADDLKNWKRLTTANGLPTNNITALHIDPLGGIWVGGGASFDGGGILHMAPTK